jgi:hypothetical protein
MRIVDNIIKEFRNTEGHLNANDFSRVEYSLKAAQEGIRPLEKAASDAGRAAGRSQGRWGGAVAGGFGTLEKECEGIRTGIDDLRRGKFSEENKDDVKTKVQALSAQVTDIGNTLDSIASILR